MRNHVSDGDRIAVTAPGAVTAGQGVLIGSLFGVAVTDAASGAQVQLACEGVFDLAKTTAQAWTVGQLLYWSGTAVTTTVGTNKLIGVCVAAADAAATVGRVRLTGASAN
jgi:predicted RecA/RadA family phage recombinase